MRHAGEVHATEVGVDQGHPKKKKSGGYGGQNQILDTSLHRKRAAVQAGDESIKRHTEDFDPEKERYEIAIPSLMHSFSSALRAIWPIRKLIPS